MKNVHFWCNPAEQAKTFEGADEGSYLFMFNIFMLSYAKHYLIFFFCVSIAHLFEVIMAL